MIDETTPPPPDLSAVAAHTVEQVEHFLDLSPLQRYVADLNRRVEALEAARDLEH